MRLVGLALTLLLAACAGGAAPDGLTSAVSRTVAFVGVTVVPMTDVASVLPRHTVLVRDGRIAAVGPSGRLRPPANARVIDGRGRWLMPGLADAHVHLEHLENPDVLKLFLAEGVTTVRSMDGRPFMLDWRRRVVAGELPGPRIVTAGPIIDGAPPQRDDNLSAATPEAARGAVREQATAGYDFVKLYGGLSPEAYRAAAAEARALGLPVAGHVPRGVPLAEAARTQTSIEHLADFAGAVDRGDAPGWLRPFHAGRLDPDAARRLAGDVVAGGAWIVPTLVERERALAQAGSVDRWTADPAARALPAEVISMWRGQLQRWTGRMDEGDWAAVAGGRRNRLALLRVLKEAGVKIALGTDTPNAFVTPGGSVHDELALFVEAGFTPGEALYAATAAPAALLGAKSGGAGVIAPGAAADLLLLSADPLADVRNARARVGVMAGGRWFEAAALEAMRGDLAR